MGLRGGEYGAGEGVIPLSDSALRNLLGSVARRHLRHNPQTQRYDAQTGTLMVTCECGTVTHWRQDAVEGWRRVGP